MDADWARSTWWIQSTAVPALNNQSTINFEDGPTAAAAGSGDGALLIDELPPTSPAPNSGHTLTETILISAALLIIIVGTIVGNILVCTAVCLVRRLRRPCNYLLVSLAVSDMCVALLVMPMALAYEILGKWPFGALVCDMWVAFDVLSCAASILNLCMISVDRYWAITRPLDYGVKRTPARMCLCVALVWITAACISLPPLLVLGNEHGTDGDEQCIVCQEFGYQIYATLGSFYIPLGVMVAVYYKIFQAAKKIVDEEKKAQSHLLLTRSAESAVMISIQPNNNLHHHGRPSATDDADLDDERPASSSAGSNEAARTTSMIIRRHSDRLAHLHLDASNNKSKSFDSWTNSANGRPTTWPDVCSTSSLNKECAAEHRDKSRPKQQTSLDIPRYYPAPGCVGAATAAATAAMGRRRNSSSASTEIHDTSLDASLNHAGTNNGAHRGSHQSAVALTRSPSHGQRRRTPSNNTTGSTGAHPSNGRNPRGSRVRLRFALNKERKASTTLGIIMSAFTLCWFPFFVLALVRPFVSQPDLVIPRWLSSLFLWLGYANSFLNPVIYATTNKDFRLPFREILCLRCKSLNNVMREDFYQSQYGNEANKTGAALTGPLVMAHSGPNNNHKPGSPVRHHALAADADDDDGPVTRTGSATAFL